MAGNANSGKRKAKQVYDTLSLILKARDEEGRGLRAILEKLADNALAGDMQAIKEINDRLDGKPAQAIVGDSDADPISLVHQIQRVIVDKNATDQDSASIQAPVDGSPV